MSQSSDDLRPETRSLLERGRDGHALSEARRRALKRAVLAQAAAGAVLTKTSAASAWTTSALNAGSVVVLVLFAGGAIHALVTGGGARAPSPRVVEAAPRVVETAARVAPPPPAVAVVPRAVAWPPPPAPAAIVARAAEPLAPVAAGPAAATRAGVATHGTVPAEPTPVVARAPAPLAATPAMPAPSVAPEAPVATLGADARMMNEAKRALNAGDTAGCLALLDEHARQFPKSVLQPERAAMRVFALCAAGRAGEAEQAARAFLATHEAGPLATRVRASCGVP